MSLLDDFESITRVINSYFPSELFKIRVTGDSQINIFVENIENNKCIELVINKAVPSILLIKDLQKCDTLDTSGIGNGKYLLKSIEHIAYDLGMTEIMIDMDASSLYIRCNNKNYDFSLKFLYLFSSGNTWYGKYGFSLKYNSDRFLYTVNEFINQPFIDIKKNSVQNFFKPKKQILIKDYFKNMLDDIQRLTRNKMCINATDDAILENYYRVLQHYIGLFDRINNINYDGPYIKNIQIEKGGTNKKSRKNKKSLKSNKKSLKNKKTKRRNKKLLRMK
jgi:hypothetical protein